MWFFLGFLSSWHHQTWIPMVRWSMAQVALAWSTTHRRSKAQWAACHSRRAGLDSQVLEEIYKTPHLCGQSDRACFFWDWIGHGGNRSMSDILIFSMSMTRLKSKVVFIVATMRWHGITQFRQDLSGINTAGADGNPVVTTEAEESASHSWRAFSCMCCA
jgi:hypothetical protein